MNFLDYIKLSFRKKIARRFTREYDIIQKNYLLKNYGDVVFCNSSNPLLGRRTLKQVQIDFYKEFVKEGDLIIDIGANIGDTSVPMALAAGSKGVTIAFEPNPFLFKVLTANSRSNLQLTNIVPYQYAITDTEDEFYYISSEASFSNGGLSKTKKSRHGKFIFPEKVKSINLYNFLVDKYSKDLPRLSFIKIDTEGFDNEIVKSIQKILVEYHPVVVAESFGSNTVEEKKELFESFSKIGYEVYYIFDHVKDRTQKKIESGEEMAQYKKTTNILAIPK